MTSETEMNGEKMEASREAQRKEIESRWNKRESKWIGRAFLSTMILPIVGIVGASLKHGLIDRLDVTPTAQVYSHAQGSLEKINYELSRDANNLPTIEGSPSQLRRDYLEIESTYLQSTEEYRDNLKEIVSGIEEIDDFRQYSEEKGKVDRKLIRNLVVGGGVPVLGGLIGLFAFTSVFDRKKKKELAELDEGKIK